MLRMVSEIKQAQDWVREQHGDEGYKTLINGVKGKVRRILEQAPDLTELQVLAVLAKDKSLPADCRLVALAAMGE